MKISLSQTYALIFLVVFLIIATAFILHSHSAPTQESYWSAQIRAVGGRAAYQAFAQSVASDTPSQQHVQAHVFGGALYAALGESGLSVCDARFSYGCFHEFLGRAIEDHGLSEVGKLNQDCQQAISASPLSCQHGIGHGILADLGYSVSDLQQALGICKNLPFNNPIAGCYRGIFMEYSMRTMLDDSGAMRPVANGDIYAPCDSVDAAYQYACAYEQPEWWHAELYAGATTSPVFAKLGSDCNTSGGGGTFKRACYEGLGTEAADSVSLNPITTVQLCKASTDSKLDQLYCISSAANTISVDANSTAAHAACNGLAGASLEYCDGYASNTLNVTNPGVPPATL